MFQISKVKVKCSKISKKNRINSLTILVKKPFSLKISIKINKIMFVTYGQICLWYVNQYRKSWAGVTILVLVPQVRCVSIPKTINTTKNALFDFKVHGWKDSKDGIVKISI